MSELLSSAAAIAANEQTGVTEAPTPDSRLKKTAKTIGWVFFAIFCLVFFTFVKLPQDRLKNFIQGNLNQFLGTKGISLTSAKSYISMGFGVSYVMKDVTVNLPPPAPPAHLDKVSVSPAIIPMIFGKMGGSLSATSGDGYLDGSFSMKSSQMSVSLKAKGFDLGKTGILLVAAGVQGGAIVSGKVNLSGDMSVPTSLDGDVDLDIDKLTLEPQSLMGFAIPRIFVSESKIALSADKGKATIKTLRLGKKPDDDIHANVTGDVTLGKQWESSTLNARATFSLSPNIMRSFILLDALLGMGKQPDGSYAFNLNGPLLSPNPTPVGK